jgi:spermidine/putrescine transport system ATP-binding protein
MGSLTLKDVTKSFDGNTVVDSIDMHIEEGQFVSLLGPSGCGKTTTLRLIAGLEKLDRGSIFLNEHRIDTMPVYRRNIGMVFQSYALFPHMTVWDNVQYGLQMRRVPADERVRRISRAIEMVHLKGYERRKPRQISGGQQQRVALARALVIEPHILLLDESLSALDKKLREEMQVELRTLQRSLGITTLFVTHDKDEALTMSDRVAIMDGGRIVQDGSPVEMYERPVNSFVANFLGEANILRGSLRPAPAAGSPAGTAAGSAPATVGGELTLESGEILPIIGTVRADGPKSYCVRPERIRISSVKEGPASIPVRVDFITYTGNLSRYRLTAEGMEIKVHQKNESAIPPFEMGQNAYIIIPADTLVPLEEG